MMINLSLEVLFVTSAFPVFSFSLLNIKNSHFHFNHAPEEVGFVVQLIVLCFELGRYLTRK